MQYINKKNQNDDNKIIIIINIFQQYLQSWIYKLVLNTSLQGEQPPQSTS